VSGFLAFILTFFKKEGCPLCHGFHEVKVFIFIGRQVKTALDTVTEITVIRIICLHNLKKRKETRQALQYTITVLPAALIPYGRIPVNAVFNAITGYFNGEIATQYAAALAIFCESRHSFRLYYMRMVAGINGWHTLFSRLQGETGKTLPEPIGERWPILIVLMEETAWPVRSNWWQAYCHSVLCYNGMGLGP
jgi:hypothetical protein